MASSSDRDRDSNGSQSKPENPFIRFRQFADAQIGSLLQGIIGLPSAFSKNPSGNGRWADFDEDLRRRDELQARQKELRDSEAQRTNRQSAEEEVQIPVKKSSGWSQSPATRQDTCPSNGSVGYEAMADLPLYSPVTKSLFANFWRSAEGDIDWDSGTRIPPSPKGWLPEYFPFQLREEQRSPNVMENIRCMVYNDLNSSPGLRSEYSLLPYLLFSSYSPIKLTIASEQSGKPFAYCEAFEDLIRTTHQQRDGLPYGFRLFNLFNTGRLPARRGTYQPAVSMMAWINRMHVDGILQQKEIRDVAHLPDLLPWHAPLMGAVMAEGTKDKGALQEPQTEQDMYEHFLRWASSPTAVPGALESLFKDPEGFIEKQLKALESPDSSDAKRTFKEILDSKFARDMRDLEAMLDKLDAKPAEAQEKPAAVEKPSKTLQNSDKVVSTSTTTSHTTHEDGTVETCVTVWKQFADGRESVTTTTHCDNPAWYDNGEPKESQPEVKPEEKVEEKKNEKKGWFWN